MSVDMSLKTVNHYYCFTGGKYDLSPGSELSITFRTTKRNGLLFYASNENSTQSLTIKQVNGQVSVLT